MRSSTWWPQGSRTYVTGPILSVDWMGSSQAGQTRVVSSVWSPAGAFVRAVSFWFVGSFVDMLEVELSRALAEIESRLRSVWLSVEGALDNTC